MSQQAEATAPTGSAVASFPWIGVIAGLATASIWGAWPVASRFGVQQTLTVMDITMLRYLVAGLILLPLVLRHGHGGLGWGRALVLTVGAGVPYMVATTHGFLFAPAGHGGLVIPSVMLTCSTFVGWWLLKDRPDGLRLTGLAFVLAGVLTTGSSALSDDGGFDQVWIGHLLFMAGGMLWATYTIFSRKWKANPLHATALVSVLSMVLFAPVYFYLRGDALIQAPVGELLFQGTAQGLFSAVLALIFFTKTVKELGAGRAAVFAALVPGLSALFAYPALGEVPSLHHLIGLALVCGGMVLALGLIKRRS